MHTVTHAEYKAILARGTPSFKDCILYVTKYPCHGCAQVIVQSGIKKIIYDEDIHVPLVPVKVDDLVNPEDKKTWRKQTKTNSYYASKEKILKNMDVYKA